MSYEPTDDDIDSVMADCPGDGIGQLRAAREENERLRAEAKESDKQHYNLCWRIEDLRAAMKRIHVQSTRRNRGTTLKSYLLRDLEIIEDVARAAINRPAAVPAVEKGGEKG